MEGVDSSSEVNRPTKCRRIIAISSDSDQSISNFEWKEKNNQLFQHFVSVTTAVWLCVDHFK